MDDQRKYSINTDVKYNYLQIIDVPDIVNNCSDKWFIQTLCKVNDSLLRLGILEGEFHWHKHDNEDEVFFVLDGHLIIETENGIFELYKQQGICIPKGLMHRTISNEKTVVLMIENSTVKPTGDYTIK
jgi:mannose-6-phosphate isomerase-like protein (cupin superfamily)